jgi:hypothetical protein
MKIIFHAGLPKTGSSFLQSFSFAKSKEFLKKGILFPNINNLNKLQIENSGNAKEFCNLIVKKDFQKALNFMTSVYQEAVSQNCNVILLSHEGLNSQLPDLFNNESFLAWARQNKISVDVLLFIRNPYDFLLSLYKQKCRTGKRISKTEFLKKTRNLDFLINLLNEPSFKSKFSLNVINYDVHKKDLKTIFLKSIFDISQKSLSGFDADFEAKRVNRSLTLKEIRLLQKVSLINGTLSKKLSRYLKKKSHSKESSSLISEFKKEAQILHQQKIDGLIEQINFYLPAQEKLSVNAK